MFGDRGPERDLKPGVEQFFNITRRPFEGPFAVQ